MIKSDYNVTQDEGYDNKNHQSRSGGLHELYTTHGCMVLDMGSKKGTKVKELILQM
jgi:hypothetical protein